MSDHVLKAFEAAFGVWTTTGYFKHKPTQHQLDGFRKGYAIAEQASADRIAQLEKALAEKNHIPDVGQMVKSLRVQIGGGPDWGDDPVGKCTARCFDFPNCKCTGLEP